MASGENTALVLGAAKQATIALSKSFGLPPEAQQIVGAVSAPAPAVTTPGERDYKIEPAARPSMMGRVMTFVKSPMGMVIIGAVAVLFVLPKFLKKS